MIAVVLVGGEGTRLRPLTLDEPKPVLPIGGVPFASLLLDRLAAAGVTRVILSCGYLPERLRAGIGEPPPGVEVEIVVEDEPLGTAGAIAFAARGRVDGPYLALNGDVLGDADLGALVRAHAERGARATILLTPVDDPTRYGVVVHGADGAVERFVEKPPSADGLGPGPWWVNAGAYVLDPDVLADVPDDRMTSIEREIFPGLVGDGLIAHRSDGYWRDIGTLESFLAANADAVGGVVATRLAGGPDATLVDHAAQVDPAARLTGPLRIGAGAVIGAEAEIGPGTVVGAGAQVGEAARIARSVLLDDAQVGARARVESCAIGRDAVVGEDASLVGCALGTGAGVTAGERLEGERRPG
ncbi:MAG: sugar phosphate nucleotidyltransferase [Gaiellales bacterium]